MKHKPLRTNADFSGLFYCVHEDQSPVEKSELQKHKQVKQKVIQFETQITFLDLKSSDMLNTPFPLEIWLLTLLGNLSTRRLFTAGRWRRVRRLLSSARNEHQHEQFVEVSHEWLQISRPGRGSTGIPDGTLKLLAWWSDTMEEDRAMPHIIWAWAHRTPNNHFNQQKLIAVNHKLMGWRVGQRRRALSYWPHNVWYSGPDNNVHLKMSSH